jgi:D-alanyl-D-alanine endopeptidase (penicillin-binding protein 7)
MHAKNLNSNTRHWKGKQCKWALIVFFLWLAGLFNASALAANRLREPTDGGPRLSARAVVVIDNKTNKILLSRSANEQRSIASLTKLQAALVFMDRKLKLNEGTVLNREDWKVALEGCRTRLELKWTYRNLDLLHAALMASDNRAVSALGRAVGLNANSLVQAMNERAKRMGLKHTHFQCPVGVSPGNVSTAEEMTRIVREASRNSVLNSIMNKGVHWVKPMRGYLKVYYRNTNPLVGSKSVSFLASKTGYNTKAGYCLATVARSQDFGEFTIVLLGCKRKADRINDLQRIFQWLRAGGQKHTV